MQPYNVECAHVSCAIVSCQSHNYVLGAFSLLREKMSDQWLNFDGLIKLLVLIAICATLNTIHILQKLRLKINAKLTIRKIAQRFSCARRRSKLSTKRPQATGLQIRLQAAHVQDWSEQTTYVSGLTDSRPQKNQPMKICIAFMLPILWQAKIIFTSFCFLLLSPVASSQIELSALEMYRSRY